MRLPMSELHYVQYILSSALS